MRQLDWPAPLSAGFRLFFLLAALAAIVVVGRTGLLLTGVTTGHTDPFGWHGHEMLFGYVAAVIAGFLLTAVPNWTATRPATGLPLLALGALWLAARIGLWDGSPTGWARLADLAFLPALVLVASLPLWRGGRPRQWLPLLVVLVIAAANALWHLAVDLGQPALAGRALGFATMLIALLIAVIGGRVVPAFTRNALAGRGIPPPRGHGLRDDLALAASVLVAVAELAAPTTAGAIALAAAAFHAARLQGWRGSRAWGEPLLLILHLGYGWLAVGYALRGLPLLGVEVSPAWALHGILVGAIGTMTLAMMSRATLGHSGRPLRAGPLLLAAFALVQLAVVARLVAPWAGYEAWIGAAVCWCLGFVGYLLRCSSLLLRTRPAG